MERYDKDTEDKQQELTTLKTNKSNNLAQINDGVEKVSMTYDHYTLTGLHMDTAPSLRFFFFKFILFVCLFSTETASR